MEYLKKTVVLKQISDGYKIGDRELSGIATVEKDNGVCTLYLSVVGFSGRSDGEYRLFLIDERDKIFSFPLGQKPSSGSFVFDETPKFDGGFAVGIVFIKDKIPDTVAYQRSEEYDRSLSDFKKAVATKCMEERKKEERIEPVVNIKPQEVIERERATEYNDEAVATENYFDIDREIGEKLNAVGVKDGSLSNENERKTVLLEENAEKGGDDSYGIENEKYAGEGEEYSENNPYYLSAGKELEELFDKFPEEPSLKNTFPDSKWVKINYSDDKYYIVGLIKENGKERYICYGIPSVYSEKEPKELEGYCSFIPVSVFDMKGEGFWMMFQDAVTGECVHVKKH